MGFISKRLLKRIGIAAITSAGAYAVSKSMDTTYKKTAKEKPPKSTNQQNGKLMKVVGWTVATSVATSLTRLLLKDKLEEKVNTKK